MHEVSLTLWITGYTEPKLEVSAQDYLYCESVSDFKETVISDLWNVRPEIDNDEVVIKNWEEIDSDIPQELVDEWTALKEQSLMEVSKDYSRETLEEYIDDNGFDIGTDGLSDEEIRRAIIKCEIYGYV